jgi:hypothetical protein
MKWGWSREFEEPIIVPPRGKRGRSRVLVTLKDAGQYITKLPKAEHSATEWQTAMEALLLAVRGAPTMLARIAIMKALHRHEVHEFKPSCVRGMEQIRGVPGSAWSGRGQQGAVSGSPAVRGV